MPAKKKAAKKATKTTSKAQAQRKSAPKMAGPRADFGAPIDGYITRQPPHLREILEALRELIEQAAPDAQSALKWGAPFYTLNGEMMCAMSAQQASAASAGAESRQEARGHHLVGRLSDRDSRRPTCRPLLGGHL
jgi:hypothetical protein